jgi:superfamily I DNA/RNA helicase
VQDTANFNVAAGNPVDMAVDLALEQEAFWDACLTTKSNLILSARAGTGKTYSIMEASRRLLRESPSLRILVLAFNKAIADEMKLKVEQEKLAIEVGTTHAIGLGMLVKSMGRPAVSLDREKKILEALNIAHKNDTYAVSRIVQSIKLCCADGNPITADHITEDLVVSIANELSFDLVNPIAATVAVSERLADPMPSGFPRAMDFSDMLRLPLIWSKARPEVDVVFVDEAQDLAEIQHLMIRRCFPSARVIGVGDPHQAIYAFRGALSDSMDLFQSVFDCKLFPLTRSRRCPNSVVSVARKLVPDFRAMPDAIDGFVSSVDQIRYVPGALALSRRNAPIIRSALSLLRLKHPVSASSNNDSDPIRNRLMGIHRSVCYREPKADTISKLQQHLLGHVEDEKDAIERRFEDNQDKIDRKTSDLYDLASCYRAILDDAAIESQSPDAVHAVLNRLFSQMKGPDVMRFLTVHRAKGLEAGSVFILEPELMPIYNHDLGCYPGQEPNVAYVAFTRAMENLYWVGDTPPILGRKHAVETDSIGKRLDSGFLQEKA